MIKDLARWVALGGVFLLPVLPLVVANSLFFPYITGKNFMFRIVVEIIFAAWLVLAFYDAEYRPRFSYIFAAFGAFLGIMLLADAFGVSPHKSFWSNYERMEGYVTLAHLGLYFIVAGTILRTEKLWNAFWMTSIGVAIMMTIYGLLQLSGYVAISQSDFRIDARLGNSAYLAIYMLFHVFMSMFLMVRTRSNLARAIYIVLSMLFIFIIVKTGTRGTVLALFGGAFVAAVFIALFERRNVLVRKIAIGSVIAVLVLGGGFYAAKNTKYVQDSPILRRLAAVSLAEGETRFTIWRLAFEGVKERPLLGWGQENFNYVFNQHYKASLYGQEPWFDRVHDIAFDWLISGGILGFLGYFSLLLTPVYYLVIRPMRNKDEDGYTVAERGILLGLLAGYTIHNVVVFDNVVSYLMFVSVLAMVHMRYSKEIPALTRVYFSEQVLSNIVAPTIAVALCVVVYLVNIPSLQAASDLIQGFSDQDPLTRLSDFKGALERGSFADQEIREQLVRLTQEVLQQSPQLAQQYHAANPKLSAQEIDAKVGDIKNQYITLSTAELNDQLKETPNDVRILVFKASFLRVIGKQDDAIAVLEKARKLSPEKQQVLFELGLAYIDKGEIDKAKEVFKSAFEYEKKNEQARMFYAAAAIYSHDDALLHSLITPEFQDSYTTNDSIARAYLDTKNYGELEKLFTARIAKSPNDLQLRISLAYVQNAGGNKDGAIQTIQDAITAFPSANKQQLEGYIASIKADAIPH